MSLSVHVERYWWCGNSKSSGYQIPIAGGLVGMLGGTKNPLLQMQALIGVVEFKAGSMDKKIKLLLRWQLHTCLVVLMKDSSGRLLSLKVHKKESEFTMVELFGIFVQYSLQNRVHIGLLLINKAGGGDGHYTSSAYVGPECYWARALEGILVGLYVGGRHLFQMRCCKWIKERWEFPGRRGVFHWTGGWRGGALLIGCGEELPGGGRVGSPLRICPFGLSLFRNSEVMWDISGVCNSSIVYSFIWEVRGGGCGGGVVGAVYLIRKTAAFGRRHCHFVAGAEWGGGNHTGGGEERNWAELGSDKWSNWGQEGSCDGVVDVFLRGAVPVGQPGAVMQMARLVRVAWVGMVVPWELVDLAGWGFLTAELGLRGFGGPEGERGGHGLVVWGRWDFGAGGLSSGLCAARPLRNRCTSVLAFGMKIGCRVVVGGVEGPALPLFFPAWDEPLQTWFGFQPFDIMRCTGGVAIRSMKQVIVLLIRN
ncbi:hypothetical protein Tco_0953859 [Tanacetum coccineum]|uniref:Uncharacterized protein n=1 Tax=Tanacetum coccineum TaxID=301880 RepID=A0ABQ5E4B2_9ASTR